MEGSGEFGVLPIVIGTIMFGGFIVTIISWLLRRQDDAGNEKSKKEKNLVTSSQKSQEQSSSSASSITSKKTKQKKRREIQQDFSHPWMIGALKGHTGAILDINFSPNGKYLASSGEDRTVLIWCTKDLYSKEKKSLRVNIEFDNANLVRWSPDGKAFIIHKSLANIIEVYKITKKSDGTPGSATKALEFPKYHEDDVVGMDISCNGRYIITCGKSNDLVIWDLKGQILSTICTNLGSTHKARISPCGRFVATSGFTPDVKVWEVNFTKTGDFKQITSAFGLGGHSSGIYDFAFNSDTSRTATVSRDGTYRFYDTKVEFEKGEDPRFLASGNWDGTGTAAIALSPNAEIIAIAHGSNLSLYSTVNGKLDTTIEEIFNGPIVCVTFDSVGEHILVAGDRHIKIFRNIPGYRASIETARSKLSQRQTSATKERLETTIVNCEKILKDFGELSS